MEENNITMVMKPGYAYVLPTRFEDLFDICTAFTRGTLFKQLDIPSNEYGK